jgi:hypothetical protein
MLLQDSPWTGSHWRSPLGDVSSDREKVPIKFPPENSRFSVVRSNSNVNLHNAPRNCGGNPHLSWSKAHFFACPMPSALSWKEKPLSIQRSNSGSSGTNNEFRSNTNWAVGCPVPQILPFGNNPRAQFLVFLADRVFRNFRRILRKADFQPQNLILYNLSLNPTRSSCPRRIL